MSTAKLVKVPPQQPFHVSILLSSCIAFRKAQSQLITKSQLFLLLKESIQESASNVLLTSVVLLGRDTFFFFFFYLLLPPLGAPASIQNAVNLTVSDLKDRNLRTTKWYHISCRAYFWIFTWGRNWSLFKSMFFYVMPLKLAFTEHLIFWWPTSYGKYWMFKQGKIFRTSLYENFKIKVFDICI